MESFAEREEFTAECRAMDNTTLTEELKNYMRQLIPVKRKVFREDMSPKTYYVTRDKYRLYKMEVDVIKMVIKEKMEKNPDHPAFKNFWEDYAEWLEEMV